MGIQKNIPNIIPGNWTSVRQVIARLASRLGPVSLPTFAGITLTDLTASRLVATDANKQLVSSDLINWVTGTANQVIVTDDSDGTITLSTPQDIHTGATPTFNTVSVTNKFKLDGGAIIEYDSESHDIPLRLADDAGSYLLIQDYSGGTLVSISTTGEIRTLNNIYSNILALDSTGIVYIDGDGYLAANNEVFKWDGSTLTTGAIVTTGNIGVSGDADLLQLAANALTVNGTITGTNINQSVTTSSSPTFNTPTVSSLYIDRPLSDYLITNRGGYFFALQEQVSGIQPSLELFTKDGDGTDNAGFIMWAIGTPGSVTNREFIQFGYITGATPYFKVNTDAGGSGTVRPLYLYAGSGNLGTHVNLLANGDVLMPGTYSDTVGGTNRDLYIDDTGKIGYVSSSAKYKKNIRDLENTERVHNLRPVMFDRIDNSAKDEVGLIAEEVEDVIPEIVSYRRIPIWGKKKSDVGDINDVEDYIIGWKTTDEVETVRYSQLIVPLLKEVQKLRQEIEQLKVMVAVK
jgi:hypothetical protein